MPVILAVSASVFLSGYARADAPDPLVDKSAVWVSGPTNVTLADVLEMEVLPGYRFTDAPGARATLGQNNPLPQGLVGYLRSNAGGLGVILAFNRVGHVKYENPVPGSYEESLKKAKGQKDIASVSWDIPPRPGPVDNSVEWAVRSLNLKGDTTINYVAQVLGRQGVLTFTAIYNGATTPDDLKVLLSKISFRTGEAYTDYKPGQDRVSDLTLAQIAARLGDPDPANAGATAANIRLIAVWVGVSVAAALGIAALVVASGRLVRAAKRLRRQVPVNSIAAAVNIPAPAASTPASSQPAVPGTKTQPAPSRNGFQPKLAPTPSTGKARNGGFAKGINGHSKSKRREFDYNRYFIDLMATVSSHGLALESVQLNGRQVEVPVVPAVSGSNGNGYVPAPYNANSELIANQTTFIEEQRRLIQEQAKLIEEKSKLIAEKNQLLQIQRELIDNKLV
jgi:uncharacterized membrane-anchored protein